MHDSFGYTSKSNLSAEQKEALLAFARQTVVQAGEATLPFFRADIEVENKLSDGAFDPVTEGDKAAEKVIRAALEETYPTHGILGEEFGYQPGNGLTWVIDPIDGTRAFMTGMLHWGVLLGLFDGEEPVIGVMYQPYSRELFWGDGVNAGFSRDGEHRVLRTSSCDQLSNAVMATTEPSLYRDHELSQFNALVDATRMCRLGGDCYLYSLVALGYLHMATDATLNPYDIQALIPIVRGAGGVVTTFDGGNPSMGGTVLASANSILHEHALNLIAQHK